jgi:mannose-6-phosphate isomerase-like protein (cupin superfamily)
MARRDLRCRTRGARSTALRSLTPVDLQDFPAPTHSKVLAGRDQGFDECQVAFSRVAPGDILPEPSFDGRHRLVFVCAGELCVQSGREEVALRANSLIRLPKELQHTARNSSTGEALCVQVGVSSKVAQADIGLDRLIARFDGHRPVQQSTGFDYQFLANRRGGSERVALNIARVLPGHRGPDFHIHKFDQFYFVLRGRLTVEVGFQKFVAEPFTLVTLPAGIVHRQGNDGKEPEEHLAIICPEPVDGQPLDYQIAMPVG